MTLKQQQVGFLGFVNTMFNTFYNVIQSNNFIINKIQHNIEKQGNIGSKDIGKKNDTLLLTLEIIVFNSPDAHSKPYKNVQ